ncbi:MAG TPA: iron ABC transporter substrate-binding protein [Acidimicrobiia bacterium]|jgi:iron(III) transport system substrate-binding protein|nr:iron ABC transporter substrate-binding protein [Acidimicrobiia bacterium]
MKSVLGLLMVAALAACGGGGAAPTGETGALVLYSGRTEELVGPLLSRFEQQTGIAVDVRYGSSPEMAATIITEGDGSPADLFYSQDPASLGSVAELLAPLPDSVLGMVPEKFSDPDGRWVGVTARSRVLAFNPELVDEADLPTSYRELIDPRWKGRFGIAPTNGSFVTFVAAMILLEGEDATSQWLDGIAANNPVTFDGNSPIAAAIDAGDLELGLINHYYLRELAAEQGSITAQNHFFPQADAGSLVMPSGVGLLATASHPTGSEALIEFLLSPESQTYFAETNFEYPVTPDAPSPPGLPALETLASPVLSSADLAAVLDRATDLIAGAGLS